jgi:nucleotide-binding universal stress UspA family protein
MHVRRILYPTDFSQATKAAARYACDLADQFNAELHLLHVLHDLTSLMPYTAVTLWAKPEHIADLVTGAQRLLDTIPDAVWANGKAIVRMVRVGHVADEITTYARQHAIDLIVIGTHGHTGLKHALLGSIAEKVVRTAGCPVLTVRDKAVQVLASAPENAAD